MCHRDERRQFERPAGPIDPCRVGFGRPPHGLFVTGRTGGIAIAGEEFRRLSQQMRGNTRPREVVAAGGIAAIDQGQPLCDAGCLMARRERLRLNIAREFWP